MALHTGRFRHRKRLSVAAHVGPLQLPIVKRPCLDRVDAIESEHVAPEELGVVADGHFHVDVVVGGNQPQAVGDPSARSPRARHDTVLVRPLPIDLGFREVDQHGFAAPDRLGNAQSEGLIAQRGDSRRHLHGARLRLQLNGFGRTRRGHRRDQQEDQHGIENQWMHEGCSL